MDHAINCSDPNACGDGECAESALGVLCECFEGGQCLNHGGELSLDIKPRPAVQTYSLDPVSYELVASAALTGTTPALWVLEVKANGLDFDVVPSSGILSPGGTVVVSVTATSTKQGVAGNLTSSFSLTPVGSTTDPNGDVKLEVTSGFHICPDFEYAIPLDHGDGDLSCEQCASIEGEEGVDFGNPGVTLALLPIREGYWRSNNDSIIVRECLHSGACVGATEVSSSDDYCGDGYKGPCESREAKL